MASRISPPNLFLYPTSAPKASGKTCVPERPNDRLSKLSRTIQKLKLDRKPTTKIKKTPTIAIMKKLKHRRTSSQPAHRTQLAETLKKQLTLQVRPSPETPKPQSPVTSESGYSSENSSVTVPFSPLMEDDQMDQLGMGDYKHLFAEPRSPVSFDDDLFSEACDSLVFEQKSPQKEEWPVELPVSIPLKPIRLKQEMETDDAGLTDCPETPLYPQGPQWITVPVEYRCQFDDNDDDMEIGEDTHHFSYTTGAELEKLLETSRHYNLVDTGTTTSDFRCRYRETCNTQVQWQVKGLVEEGTPTHTPKQHRKNVLVKAEAARQLRFVRCDDRCYFWMALWLRSETQTDQALMMQVDFPQPPPPPGTKPVTPNHYFLLVPPPGESNPFEIGVKGSLICDGKINLALVEELYRRGFWLIDPATQTKIPVTVTNIERHLRMVCALYGFNYANQATLSCVEHLTKDGPVSNSTVERMNKRARKLLPMATLLATNSDISCISSLKTRMRTIGLEPTDVWPDKVRTDTPWGYSVVYCLKQLYPESSRIHRLLKDDHRPTDFDILACYKTDTPEYLDALKRRAIHYMQTGKSAQDCLTRMSTYGFFGDHKSDGGWDCRHKPYLIPPIKGIPDRFWNTPYWEQLGEQGLLAIGVDPKKYRKTLKEMLEIQMKNTTTRNYNVINQICLHYRHLWIGRPDIRQSLKDDEHMSSALIRHFIHVEGAKVPAHLQQLQSFIWQPIDTLRVCTPKSMHYKQAMKLLLTNSKDNKQIAKQLTKNGHGVQVELPKTLRKQGFTEWNEHAISTLKRLMEARDITPEILPGDTLN